jgi:hypothetical protein
VGTMHIDVATFESKHAERRRGFIHRGMYQLRGVANSVLGFEKIDELRRRRTSQ